MNIVCPPCCFPRCGSFKKSWAAAAATARGCGGRRTHWGATRLRNRKQPNPRAETPELSPSFTGTSCLDAHRSYGQLPHRSRSFLKRMRITLRCVYPSNQFSCIIYLLLPTYGPIHFISDTFMFRKLLQSFEYIWEVPECNLFSEKDIYKQWFRLTKRSSLLTGETICFAYRGQ